MQILETLRVDYGSFSRVSRRVANVEVIFLEHAGPHLPNPCNVAAVRLAGDEPTRRIREDIAAGQMRSRLR
jgi:hypothetical protein